ncbi:MAG: helix-turn-helix domain-containing protein [Methanobrevibacter sp.]|jgi:DNA-binding MarR family transcriptional regulator|nr:helix-turn-helix domain-containing protein [Methanobrevibacter sp.]
MKEEIVDLIAYIKLSPYRKDLLRFLSENIRIPSEIAKVLDTSPPNVSRLLKGLEEKELIVCLTPNKKIGRLYKATELGNEVLNYFK